MIRLLPWFMLLHHIPGKCAPEDADGGHSAAGEPEYGSDGRVREHLLGEADNVDTGVRARMIAALEREVNGRARVLAWAAREIEQASAVRQDSLGELLGGIQETYRRETEKVLRQTKAIENTQQPRWRL